jgi:hypothetical protein
MADERRELSRLSSGDLTLESLDARLQRLELSLQAEDNPPEDCGTFIPCKRLKSCGSFHLTAPAAPGSN